MAFSTLILSKKLSATSRRVARFPTVRAIQPNPRRFFFSSFGRFNIRKQKKKERKGKKKEKEKKRDTLVRETTAVFRQLCEHFVKTRRTKANNGNHVVWAGRNGKKMERPGEEQLSSCRQSVRSVQIVRGFGEKTERVK